MKNKTWLNKIMWGREGKEEERRGRKQTKTKKIYLQNKKHTKLHKGKKGSERI